MRRAAVVFVKVLGRKADIALAIQRLDLEHWIHRRAARRQAAQALIEEPVQPVVLVPAHPAPHCAHLHVQNLRHLLLREPAHLLPLVQLFETHGPDLL